MRFVFGDCRGVFGRLCLAFVFSVCCARTFYDYLVFYIVYWAYYVFFITAALGLARALRSADRP